MCETGPRGLPRMPCRTHAVDGAHAAQARGAAQQDENEAGGAEEQRKPTDGGVQCRGAQGQQGVQAQQQRGEAAQGCQHGDASQSVPQDAGAAATHAACLQSPTAGNCIGTAVQRREVTQTSEGRTHARVSHLGPKAEPSPDTRCCTPSAATGWCTWLDSPSLVGVSQKPSRDAGKDDRAPRGLRAGADVSPGRSCERCSSARYSWGD